MPQAFAVRGSIYMALPLPPRRRGAGSRLLQAAIGQARSWPGVTQVHLSVSTVANEARRIYEGHGFRVWGVEPRALCWEGLAADEIHMILAL